jgi:competence protein ComEA
MKRIAFLLALLPLSFAALATVNLNTAQQSDLQRLKGLDKYKAKALIEYRHANGPFTSLEDLQKVPGFDRSVIETLKPQVALTGPAFSPPTAESKKK